MKEGGKEGEIHKKGKIEISKRLRLKKEKGEKSREELYEIGREGR
jgi:hypothetical protein